MIERTKIAVTLADKNRKPNIKELGKMKRGEEIIYEKDVNVKEEIVTIDSAPIQWAQPSYIPDFV
jgi:hypothetical protein